MNQKQVDETLKSLMEQKYVEQTKDGRFVITDCGILALEYEDELESQGELIRQAEEYAESQELLLTQLIELRNKDTL